MSINSTKARYRRSLAREQNDKCFFCFLRMGEDCTLEHFLAQYLGGKDNYGNLRAAHAKCNSLVGHLPVEEKQRLHEIGRDQGSDAFFLEINRLRSKEKKRKSKRRAEAKRILLENTSDMYRSTDSYAASYAMLPPHLQRMFYAPLPQLPKEKTPAQIAAARSKAAVRKMLERQQGAQ